MKKKKDVKRIMMILKDYIFIKRLFFSILLVFFFFQINNYVLIKVADILKRKYMLFSTKKNKKQTGDIFIQKLLSIGILEKLLKI